jgi:hypothetical protein
MPRRENATASEESLGIRGDADSPAEEFAKNGPVACYGVLAAWPPNPDAGQWAGRVERGLVRIATLTQLETGYSARSCPDLRAVIAATAELAALTVLHLDKDFDTIARITGQPMERLTTA